MQSSQSVIAMAFFQDSGTTACELQKTKAIHHVSAVQVAADPGPTTHVIIAVG
jgi:hypothetical protein